MTYWFACTSCGTALTAVEDPGFDPESNFAAFVEPAIELTCPGCAGTCHTNLPVDPGTTRLVSAELRAICAPLLTVARA